MGLHIAGKLINSALARKSFPLPPSGWQVGRVLAALGRRRGSASSACGRTSRLRARVLRSPSCLVRHVLDKLLNGAIEESAESIQHVGGGVVALLAAQLGERYAVNSRAAGNLVERDAASGRKGHIGNPLLESESDHVVLRLPKMSGKWSF